MTPTPKGTEMTDQNMPADEVREIAAAMRAAMRNDDPDYTYGKFLSEMTDLIKDLEDLTGPKHSTMAEMAPEERRDCQWMQADTKQWGRVVIIAPDLSAGRAALLDVWGDVIYEYHASVTPLPDLPRMEWPSVKKPDPAPALPDGWRLADHKDHGRVVVTNTSPDADGHVYYVLPSDGPLGYDWFFCTPDDLTYLAQ